MKTTPCLDTEDALLMYTSGTTGKPKGVRQTHRTNTASVEMVIDTWQLTSKYHLLGTFPMFHVGGLQCTTLPVLFTGGTVTLLARCSAEEWVGLTRKLKPTWTGVVSTMLVDIVNYALRNPVEKNGLNYSTFAFLVGLLRRVSFVIILKKILYLHCTKFMVKQNYPV